MDCLFEGVAGKHSEHHGNAPMSADFFDSARDGPVDVLVVRRFAADYGPQANYRLIFAGGGELLSDQRNLKGARHPGHVDVLVWHTVGR